MLSNTIIIIPATAALLAAVVPWPRLRSLLVPVTAFIHLTLVCRALAGPEAVNHGHAMLGMDPLGGLTLLVVSLLFAVSSIYAMGYFRCHPTWDNRIFTACLLIFLSAMSLAALARHLGVLWVAVEATTLVSAPLIYHNRNKFSIEATWKYLLLCSMGIALAMLGILFVAYAGLQGGGEANIHLNYLLSNGSLLSKPWLRAGFVFLLVGFGTKMGLAPLHTWKPDAYGEAPGLVGGLLAGGLTSIAFLAILRAMQIMTAAGEQAIARQCLMAMGVTSLLFAALFVIRQRDIKRMLAYSSVEHMGILAIGISVGGLATYGAMFHMFNNALTKGSLFMSAGNIHRHYGSKRQCEILGSLSVLPVSAGVFLAGFLAIAGSPPFGVFLSEFTILRGIVNTGHPYLTGGFILLLTVIFIGMAGTVLPVTLGPTYDEEGIAGNHRETLLTAGAPLLLLLGVFVVGLYLPAPLQKLFSDAAALLEVTP